MGFVTFCVLYFLAIFGYSVVGTIMVVRRRQSMANAHFAIFCFILAAWQLVQLLAQMLYKDHDAAVFFMRSSAFLGAYVGIWFMYFASTYTKRKPYYKSIFVLGTVIALLTIFSTGLQQSVVTQNGFKIEPIDPFYALDLLWGSLTAFTGTYFIFRNYLQYRRGFHRHDTLLVIGITLSLLAIMGISAISSSNFAIQIIAPLLCLFSVGLVAYSLLFQGTFDLRIFTVRAMGYLITILAMAMLYGSVIYLCATFGFDLKLNASTLIYLSLSTGILGLTFQRFKRIFDRITNKVFYRDAYDTEELFDRLNKTLVSSLNIDYLLKRTADIIDESIKVQFVAFELKNNVNNSSTYRHLGDQIPHSITAGELAKIRTLSSNTTFQVIVTDFLDESHAKLRQLLQTNDIAAVVRLSSDTRKGHEGLGFMLLGAKKSGNTYASQDIQTLENIAKELLLAVQNSLHFEETQHFNAVLQNRVDTATRKLRNSNEKLRSLDETKDDFISMASHQLRTPLTSVKGYLSLLLEGDAGPINDAQRRMLSQAFISSQRMVFLIADLLNVSRLKTGKFVLEPKLCNVAKMVAEEIGQLKETIDERDIHLIYDQPANFPDLTLDETKTRQVIMNFLDNALYYTPPGGHIKIELTEKPQKVELRIIDDGIGVPKSEQRHLFTKFYRAGNARKTRPDGTGLGLFMAKKVIDAQGGTVLFESVEGKGSTFGFWLPKKQPKFITEPIRRVSAPASK